jgi:pilus assembly protein CpaB
MLRTTQINPRNVTLLLAAVLTLGTGLLLFNYLSGVNSAANKVEEKRVVLVASHAIAAQTTISADALTRVVKPATSVEPDAVSPEQLALVVGSVALVAIPEGGTITQSRIARPSSVSLEAKVKEGLRAITIPIDQVKGVAGLIQTGDHVDVIAVTNGRGKLKPLARTIMRGVEVLALGDSFAIPTAGSGPSPSPNQTTATLEVTPPQADLLALADLNSALRLILRSPKEPIRSLPPEGIVFVAPADADGPLTPAPPVAAAPAPKQAPRPARAREDGPTIIDGDQVVGTKR